MSRRNRFLIFDFDGTLADTFDLFLKIFDEAAILYGFRPFDRKKMEYLRTIDARSILRHHRVPLWKVPAITHTTRKLMERYIHGVHLFPEIDLAISQLHDSGAKLALLTSNSRSNVLHVFGRELAARFDYLECGSSIFGKPSRLKRLLARSGFSADDVVFIGDEIRDAHAARRAGISFGAVSWGYGAVSSLVRAGASESFAEPGELMAKLMP